MDILKFRNRSRVTSLTSERTRIQIMFTKNTNRCGTVKMVAIMTLPIISVMIYSVFLLERARTRSKVADEMQEKFTVSKDIHKIVHQLQVERGRTASFFGNVSDRGDVYGRHTNASRVTDSLITSARIPSNFHINNMTSNDDIKMTVNKIRTIARDPEVTLKHCLNNYTELIRGLLLFSKMEVLEFESDITSTMMLVSNAALLFAIDAIGLQRALGSLLYLECDISRERLEWFLFLRGESDTYLKSAFDYDNSVLVEYQNQISNNTLAAYTDKMFMEINPTSCRAVPTDQRLVNSLKWFDDITNYMSVLIKSETIQSNRIVSTFEAKSRMATDEVITYILSSVAAIVVCLATSIWHSWSVTKMTRRIQMYAKQIADKSWELGEEKLKTERLLFRMLPPNVAQKLKDNQDVSPEHYDSSTIFFSDIVGFTDIGSRSSPFQIVDLLNSLYCVFDKWLDKYDVYKVETIGDAYMVVSGVPVRNGIRHAAEIAQLSLSIRSDISDFVIPHMEAKKLKIRIGLHSGPVVAGIVGTKMPRYCLFGDSVNVASRMESTSEAMKIQISEDTQKILVAVGGYDVFYRGVTKIKGKGNMSTYWLNGTL